MLTSMLVSPPCPLPVLILSCAPCPVPISCGVCVASSCAFPQLLLSAHPATPLGPLPQPSALSAGCYTPLPPKAAYCVYESARAHRQASDGGAVSLPRFQSRGKWEWPQLKSSSELLWLLVANTFIASRISGRMWIWASLSGKKGVSASVCFSQIHWQIAEVRTVIC